MTKNKLYEQHKVKCAARGIKIVRDSYDSKDENLKREVQMLEEEDSGGFLEMMEGNWSRLFLPFFIFVLVLGTLLTIFVKS